MFKYTDTLSEPLDHTNPNQTTTYLQTTPLKYDIPNTTTEQTLLHLTEPTIYQVNWMNF